MDVEVRKTVNLCNSRILGRLSAPRIAAVFSMPVFVISSDTAIKALIHHVYGIFCYLSPNEHIPRAESHTFVVH